MSGLLSDSPYYLPEKEEYEVVVIGSGYGGSILTARLAEQGYEVCLLERGKEWVPGTFPDDGRTVKRNLLKKRRPLGLYEYLEFDDINVFRGSGLGGTSLINANIAIRPDLEFFTESYQWPDTIRQLAANGDLWQYFARAESVLQPELYPGIPFQADDGTLLSRPLRKVESMKEHYQTLDPSNHRFHPSLNLTVNFDSSPEGYGENDFGMLQAPCVNCGDCFTGCNVRAKKTLYMNYLPLARRNARQSGAELRIFTQVSVESISRAGGRFVVEYTLYSDGKNSRKGSLVAKNVVLAAGSPGSTEILLRSDLPLSSRLGVGFTGNGDFYGIAYNSRNRTDILGSGNHPESARFNLVKSGPSIVSGIQYRAGSFAERFIVEDANLPGALVEIAGLGLAVFGPWGNRQQRKRQRADLESREPEGALNHSMVYLVMGIDDNSDSRIFLDGRGRLKIEWQDVAGQPVFERINTALAAHAETLGAKFVRNFSWVIRDRVTTVHPLGGCAMARSADQGVVNEFGQVYQDDGEVLEGLYVVDGSMIPGAIGVNPFLTISALAERIAETIPGTLVS